MTGDGPLQGCICVWQLYEHTKSALRLIHPQCPHHGTGAHWKAIPE